MNKYYSSIISGMFYICLISSCVGNQKNIVKLEQTYKEILLIMSEFKAKHHPLGWLMPKDENGKTPIYEGFELQDGTKYLLLFYAKLSKGKQIGNKTLKAIFTVKKGADSYNEYGHRLNSINLTNHVK